MSDQPVHKITKVEIDRDVCIGAASCMAVAADGFELDQDNKATLKPGWRTLTDEQLMRAAKACPVLAIALYDGDGKKIYPTP